MTVSHPLSQLVDYAALYAVEHQLHFASLVGADAAWQYDSDARELVIDVGGVPHVFRAHLLGYSHANEWTWSWADPAIHPADRTWTRSLYDYGSAAGIDALITPTVAQIGFLAADRLAIASKPVIGQWTSFTATVDDTDFHLVLDDRRLQLPPANCTTVAQTVAAAGEPGAIASVHAALRGYAHHRHLAYIPGTSPSLGATGWQVDVAVTADDTIADLTIRTAL